MTDQEFEHTCQPEKKKALFLEDLKFIPAVEVAVPCECDQNYIKYMQYLQGTNFTRLSPNSMQYQRTAVPSSAIMQAARPQAEMPCIFKRI